MGMDYKAIKNFWSNFFTDAISDVRKNAENFTKDYFDQLEKFFKK